MATVSPNDIRDIFFKMKSFLVKFLLVIVSHASGIVANPRQICREEGFTKFIVSIQANGIHKCNGVILNSYLVITTALCVTDYIYRQGDGTCDCGEKPTVVYDIRPGNLKNLYCSKTTNVVYVKIKKTQCLNHLFPQFQRHEKWVYMDIALVIVEKMTLDPNFRRPAIASFLPPAQYWSDEWIDDRAVLAGYWTDGKQVQPEGPLTCANVTFARMARCEKKVGVDFDLQPTLFCTDDEDGTVAGVCAGHVGAPLFFTDNRNQKVVLGGFLSHRHGLRDECGTKSPIFYTRADRLMPLILQIDNLPEFWNQLSEQWNKMKEWYKQFKEEWNKLKRDLSQPQKE